MDFNAGRRTILPFLIFSTNLEDWLFESYSFSAQVLLVALLCCGRFIVGCFGLGRRERGFSRGRAAGIVVTTLGPATLPFVGIVRRLPLQPATC